MRGLAGFVVVGLCVLGGSALADKPMAPTADPDPDASGSGAQPRLIPSGSGGNSSAPPDTTDLSSHKGQIGLSARFALIGMSAIKPYSSSDYCGATNSDGSISSVCINRLPVSLDLEPSFGVSRHAELIVEFRIGLESDFAATSSSNNGPHIFHIAPGARFFFSEGRRSKLFTTAQAVFDFTGYDDSAGKSRGTDIGVRNMNGLWIDLDRAYGFYFYVGETASFARWIRLDLEAGLGFQLRFL